MKTLRLYGAGLLVALLLTLAAHGSSSPDFTLSLNPTSLTVQQGSSGTTQLTVTPQGGFTGTVSLSLVGAPSGVTLSATSVSVTGSSPVTLTVSVGSGVAPGTYNLQVRATSGSLTKTAGLSLTVTASGGGGGGGGGSGVGTTWTSRTSQGNLLNGVAYGNGTFVAVGRNGTILTSPDGVGWTQRTSGTSNHLNGVTYGNGLFVAVGERGAILTSPDGVNWTLRTSGTATPLRRDLRERPLRGGGGARRHPHLPGRGELDGAGLGDGL
jgi:hypothetical protein